MVTVLRITVASGVVDSPLLPLWAKKCPLSKEHDEAGSRGVCLSMGCTFQPYEVLLSAGMGGRRYRFDLCHSRWMGLALYAQQLAVRVCDENAPRERIGRMFVPRTTIGDHDYMMTKHASSCRQRWWQTESSNGKKVVKI